LVSILKLTSRHPSDGAGAIEPVVRGAVDLSGVATRVAGPLKILFAVLSLALIGLVFLMRPSVAEKGAHIGAE
jgi:hypothetical protein